VFSLCSWLGRTMSVGWVVFPVYRLSLYGLGVSLFGAVTGVFL
jgi:hypothetical protein